MKNMYHVKYELVTGYTIDCWLVAENKQDIVNQLTQRHGGFFEKVVRYNKVKMDTTKLCIELNLFEKVLDNRNN